MGNYLGRLNQLVMLLACLGTVALSVTGPIMWWRRRPKGRLAAPKTLEAAPLKAVALITLAIAALFPLAGLSLVLALVIDKLIERFQRRSIDGTA